MFVASFFRSHVTGPVCWSASEVCIVFVFRLRLFGVQLLLLHPRLGIFVDFAADVSLVAQILGHEVGLMKDVQHDSFYWRVLVHARDVHLSMPVQTARRSLCII